MSIIDPDAAATLLATRMMTTFGLNREDYLRERSRGPVSRAYLNNAIRIVDRSGVVAELAKWQKQERKSNAGVKAFIPFRAVLVLFLLHVQLGLGANYHKIAETLDVHFTAESFALLGISDVAGDHDDWYQRLWRSAKRMMKLIDPHDGPRNEKLTAECYAELRAKASTPKAIQKTKRNHERLDWVCEQLLHTSVRMLPADIRDKYEGNLAVDATVIVVPGSPNPTDKTAQRGNADSFSGRYRREGKHDGQGAKTDLAAYELETGVMVWNKPGENLEFPSLITSISFHRPGRVAGEGVKVLDSHRRLGITGGLLLVDRAYNNGKIEGFHIPVRQRNFELVLDYKKTNVGLQSQHKDLILVDGNWYVTWMPQNLIDATKHRLRVQEADEQTGEVRDRLAKELFGRLMNERNAYRLKAKGKPDKDGFQRFTYPTPGTYMAIDRATGKRVAKPQTAKSITIPIDAGGTRPAIKHLQKFPYASPEHKAHYGMRSLVESSNKTLKGKNKEDLANVSKRSGRGFAFNYLISALASVSSNLRKIFSFFEKVAARDSGGKLSRLRRRKSDGVALVPVTSSLPALAPPQ